MPERQSSSRGATARPETDGTDIGTGQPPGRRGTSGRTGSSVTAEPAPGGETGAADAQASRHSAPDGSGRSSTSAESATGTRRRNGSDGSEADATAPIASAGPSSTGSDETQAAAAGRGTATHRDAADDTTTTTRREDAPERAGADRREANHRADGVDRAAGDAVDPAAPAGPGHAAVDTDSDTDSDRDVANAATDPADPGTGAPSDQRPGAGSTRPAGVASPEPDGAGAESGDGAARDASPEDRTSAVLPSSESPTVVVRAATATPPPDTSHRPGTWFNPDDPDPTESIPRATAVGPAAAAGTPTSATPTSATPAPSVSGGSPLGDEATMPTRAMPPARAPLTAESAERTAVIRAPQPAAPPPPPPPAGAVDDSGTRPPRRRRRLLIVAGVVALLALLYVGDLALTAGTVPRGVTVAGVQVGGLGIPDAERQLRAEIEPRTSRPVAVTVGDATSEIDPATAGLTVDWSGTLDQAGSQPLNPITRVTSFFTQREVGVVTATDQQALTSALEELAPVVDKPPVEGSVRFDGSTPVAVDPVPGQQLTVPAAAAVLEREWATGDTVPLPLVELPATTTAEDVAAAIEDVARPAVSAPVTVVGEGGTSGTLTPRTIATALSFRADAGALVPELNLQAITEALKPQLAASERPGRDASLDFASGTPVVVPSQDGRGIDYEATLKDVLGLLTGSEDRRITAVYADQPADVTTDELNNLGITGVIGEFTTGGFAADSGRNIKRAAEQINGKIVEPGETFSLNAATVPRNEANGYVEAGIISDGTPSRGIGGGVSQLATTLYNASYFAGMEDVTHQEHSFYISRYPAGREATVFENAIDLKFRNPNPTGVLIQTAWTPTSLTVRIYGTKRFEVTSTPGPRTNPTNPNTVTIPAGRPCKPSGGAPGFTVTDTRTIREISTGQVSTETQTVKYNPSPIVVCSP